MITVHHLETSRSHRVLWLLEELEIPYEIVNYKRDPKTSLAPEALTKVHPLGKSPVITDGDVTVAESGTIIEYLQEKYGNGKLVPPAGTQAFRDCRYFMHYAEGSMMPYLLLTLIFNRIRNAPVPFFIKPIVKKIAGTVSDGFINPNMTRHIAFLESHLAKNTWFAGDELSIADIQMSYVVEALMSRGKNYDVTRITALGKRIHERPAYQRALAKGGPVMLDS